MQTMQRHNPEKLGLEQGHRLHGNCMDMVDMSDTWAYVMGPCDDFPATAPQWGRVALPSPSGTPLPILRLVVSAARRVCCAMTVWSEWRIVIVLCGRRALLRRRR